MHIEHLAIWVDNIELIRDFYIKYFGTTCSAKYFNPKRNYTSFFLAFEGGNTRIELMHIPDGQYEPAATRQLMKGLAHIALTVGSKETVNALTEQLRQDGYTIASEPRTTGDGYYESGILDPEGNYIELLAE